MHKVLLTLALAGASIAANPATVPPAPSTNAALRYWMAFAALHNAPADEATARLLDDVASGTGAWDEARLGPIVEQNAEALGILRRASVLPLCAWGLEVELGPDAPMQHVARARALARLNVLQGVRLRSRGASVEAIDTWLAGVRFARHLGQDGPLLQVLVAGASLSANLRQIENVLAEGHVAAAAIGRVERELRALPPYALDWTQAWALEKQGLDIGLQHLAQAGSDDLVRQVTGSEQPTSVERQSVAKDLGLSEAQLGDSAAVGHAVSRLRTELGALMDPVVAASRLPYTQARERLAGFDAMLAKANPILRRLVPSPARANQARAELETRRAGVLGLVVLTQQHLKNGRDALALAGLGVPDDPFSGRPFELAVAGGGLELRSSGHDSRGQALVYRLKR